MTGFIYDIKRFTLHDGPGIRTTVFFKGCPLFCSWCHNPESISFQPIKWKQERHLDGRCFIEHETIGHDISSEELLCAIQRDQHFYRESGGGVTFSGGEPLSQPTFLLEMLHLCQNTGIHSCVDTSAFASQDDFSLVAEQCNLLMIDLKHADDAQHLRFTKVSNKIIINNIKSIKHLSTPVWLRLPMIPGFNMDPQSWNGMLDLLDEIKSDQIKQIHLLPFHHTAAHKYLKCGMNDQMMEVESVQKSDLLSYYQQLSHRGWKKLFIGG